jgi:hypothetical protein
MCHLSTPCRIISNLGLSTRSLLFVILTCSHFGAEYKNDLHLTQHYCKAVNMIINFLLLQFCYSIISLIRLTYVTTACACVIVALLVDSFNVHTLKISQHKTKITFLAY